jgi:solute carrier family 13 (sodium-dependent dicarboxylate transporter), member 2/3/5
MSFKSRGFQLGLALALGVIVMLLPRPEGTQFRISGDSDKNLIQATSEHFTVVDVKKKFYIVEAKSPGAPEATNAFLKGEAAKLDIEEIRVDYVNGLSPQGKNFLAVLVVLIVLFVLEPIPLEMTAILIGVLLVLMGVGDVREVWAPYMHPVVIFIMCCLIFAIALDKSGITRRLGYR